MNMQAFMQMYQAFSQNPLPMLAKRFNIPQGINNPEQIVQHLLNSGQITQMQVNNAVQNVPQFRNMLR